MNIFSSIPAGDSYDSIQMAVTSIARRGRALRERGLLEPPWSLVELRPDSEDFDWLCDWMRQLPSGVAQRCLEDGQWRKFEIGNQRISYTTGIGTLLLLSATEIARRATDERSLWAGISRGYFTETTRKLLFAQGYPSRAYRDAVEQAARWLDLRHVFGMQGLQNWYDTIYLQFGFSRQGMMRRLPEWLAGWGETFSVQQLLQGKRMRSKSFSRLWETLRLFQRGNCTEAQFRAIVRESPWVLPEWTNDLVRLARERPRLSDSSGIIVESGEEGEASFLDAPLLRWDISSPPRFVCPVKNLARLDLQGDTYDIVIAGRVCGRLHRRDDGSYRVTPSDEIELPIIAPQLAASLMAADGQVVQNLTLQLWDENEDVTTFYKSNGRRFDPWKNVMRPTSEVFLLLADDLALEPPVHYWHVFKQQGIRLHYLPVGWSEQTRALLSDQVLWQPYLASLPTAKSAEQDLAKQIRILPYARSSPIAFGDSLRLRITLPPNADLVFIRACGQPMEFEWLSTNEVRTEEIVITPRNFSFEEYCRIELLLGIKASASAASPASIMRLHASAELPITGAAVLTASGWAALRPGDVLEREQASMQPVKMFLMEIDEWDVLEGDVWVRHLSQHPRPLTTLSGYGAPLKLSRGVYNMLEEPRRLAREVVDHGNLVDIAIDAPAGNSSPRILSLRLARPIEPSEQYTIHWWDRMGTLRTLVPEWSEVQGEGTWWPANISPDLTEPIAIAIAYNGTRLGSWWDDRWNTAVRWPMQHAPRTTAALMRWFHLPVLSQGYLLDVRSLVFAYPGETLAAWVSESGLPPALHWSEIDDGWLSAVRTIFWNWRPTSIPVQEVMEHLLPMDAQQDLLEALTSITWKLLRVSPLLIGLAVKQWAGQEVTLKWGVKQSRALIQQLIYNLAEAEGRDELQKKMTALEQDAVTTMGVDPRFIERSLIRRAFDLLEDPPMSLNRLDQDNLAIAMNVEPFRRLLGIKLFEHILQSIR